MTNPYQPSITPASQSTGIRRPWLICLLVTFAVVPVWFVFLGIPTNVALSLLAFVFVAPMNSLAIAPFLAHLSGRSIARATILHVVVSLLILGGPFYWPSIVRQIPSLGWTIRPFYLILILVPPILFGSLWYSITFIKRSRQYGENK